MTPLLVEAFTATSCLGAGLQSTRAALQGQRSGLAACAFETVDLDTHVGEVAEVDCQRLPPQLGAYDCRNNRLAELALGQDGFTEAVAAAAARHGAHRVGVFLGTSTAGILETELAYRQRDAATGALPPAFDYRCTHNAFSVTDYVRRRLALTGPAATVSCACASSAKVFSSAQRLIEAGIIDAAVVGGVDSLCLTTLYGFHALQLASALPCRPFDVGRDGISIGEAGAFALLTRAPAPPDAGAILLLGSGESSDAHHISAPHPDGLGARLAMEAALAAANLAPSAVDYINLHGTGTPSNDRAESRAVHEVFGSGTPCSSTKGATGHALGAAGALEAVVSMLAIGLGLMPGGVNTQRLDPSLAVNYLRENRRAPVARVLSNSFGFGGSNCCLIFGCAG